MNPVPEANGVNHLKLFFKPNGFETSTFFTPEFLQPKCAEQLIWLLSGVSNAYTFEKSTNIKLNP